MDSVASRYAIAWLKLGEELNVLPLFRDQVLAMQTEFETSSPLYHYLMNAFIGIEDKYALLDRVFQDQAWSNFDSFIKVIVQKKRVRIIPNIFKEFIHLSNQVLGIKRARIFTSFPMNEDQVQTLVTSLEKSEKIKLEPEVIVDPTLIGGIKIEIEGTLIDGSIRQRLHAMKDQLLKRGKL
jgi:F-type H+-transporting ATPase subunit delta